MVSEAAATAAAAAAVAATRQFIPRATFGAVDSIPRSYFLGHHRAGLAAMKSLLASIDVVLECRDYRVPLTSRNPLFESSLAGRERVIVYTKRDLGSYGRGIDKQREDIIKAWHAPAPVLFSDYRNKTDVRRILNYGKSWMAASASLTGARMLVVGMPNVGKSSLLNALRHAGLGKGKAARTGDQPGVTRKIGTCVKVAVNRPPARDRRNDSGISRHDHDDHDDDGRIGAREGNAGGRWAWRDDNDGAGSSSSSGGGGGGGGGGEGLYVLDTPGVFMPYVPDAEAMLKLALCASVKDTVVPPTTLADYLLFRLNLFAPNAYEQYCAPTNDVAELLAAVARKTGRLCRGGAPDVEAAALWLVQRWRTGHLGRFVLDDVTPDALERARRAERLALPSLTQARKAEKAERRARGAAGRELLVSSASAANEGG